MCSGCVHWCMQCRQVDSGRSSGTTLSWQSGKPVVRTMHHTTVRAVWLTWACFGVTAATGSLVMALEDWRRVTGAALQLILVVLSTGMCARSLSPTRDHVHRHTQLGAAWQPQTFSRYLRHQLTRGTEDRVGRCGRRASGRAGALA